MGLKYTILESSESHGIGKLKKYGNEPLARTLGFQIRAFWMQLGSKVALICHVVEESFFKMAASPLWEKKGCSSSGENFLEKSMVNLPKIEKKMKDDMMIIIVQFVRVLSILKRI